MKEGLSDNRYRKQSRRAVEAAATAWLARRDKGLTAEEEEELRGWLSANPAHGAALERYCAAWATMDRPRNTGTAEQVLAAAKLHSVRRRRKARQVRALAAAAGIALIAVFVSRPGDSGLLDSPRSRATVLAPRQDVMPDGSVAQLKDGTQIALAFSERERHVDLVKGTAHFEVAKDAERPFVVAAGDFAIRAVGTAFSVQNTSDGVQVVVTEGTVAVECRPAAGVETQRGSSSYLEAGHRMVLDHQTTALPAPVPVSQAEISELLAWREPRLEFSGTPLAEAVAMLNESNRLQLHVEDRAVADIQVSGVFRTNNVEEFVLVLESGFGVKAERRTSSEIILRKAR